MIEIYGFPQCLKTRDILQAFQSYRRSEFCVKWVNDTHAIGIFASDRQGQAHDYHNYYVVYILYCMGFSVARMWLPWASVPVFFTLPPPLQRGWQLGLRTNGSRPEWSRTAQRNLWRWPRSSLVSNKDSFQQQLLYKSTHLVKYFRCCLCRRASPTGERGR